MDIGRNLYTLGELGDTGGDVTEHDLKKRSFGLGLLGGGWILRALEFGPFEIWEVCKSELRKLSVTFNLLVIPGTDRRLPLPQHHKEGIHHLRPGRLRAR